MSKALVIVESPAKARTISAFLGKDYVVESSIGHIRDLPRSAADIPPKLKKSPWARLGVDVENDFRPLYIVDSDKKSQISKLKSLLKGTDELLLATDEDREGESIAWHLLEVLKPQVPVKRMVFHEITEKAIQHAIDNPREIDRNLVNAQEARRILDRLYGYEVSPVLWKKVMPRLSAGRVQSVATRMIVSRERERMAFRPAVYWDIDSVLRTRGEGAVEVNATSVALNDLKLATGKDFDSNGVATSSDVVVLGQDRAEKLCAQLTGADLEVASVECKPYKRTPAAPFMTSTLQQEAGRKLRFTSSRAMRAAQTLYEAGLITYMRTDSTTLSEVAVTEARRQVQDRYGDSYLPKAPRTYRKKVKNAQEAHEAIRPAGEVFRAPAEVAKQVGADEAKLYELIWKRTIACQMEDARGESLQVRVRASTPDGDTVTFALSGNTIRFPGFLRAYVEGSDDPDAELENRERHLPPLKEGDKLDGVSFTPDRHETLPPARYTEASLVRRLEELGVGRPSTYASIISTIQARGYVWKKGSALIPSFKAFAVTKLLENHFAHLVDYTFTARMEDELDAIARGDEASVPWLHRFYFGDVRSAKPANTNSVHSEVGLKAMVAHQLGEIDARAVNTIPLGADPNGEEIVVRVGRYGPYVQRGESTARIPDDIPPDQLSIQTASELLDAPSGDRELGADPESGLTVSLRSGRFGAYVQLGEQEANSKEKPKRASLLSSMTADELTLEEALRLLALPRKVGVAPDGEEVFAHNGRYGPYLVKGSDNRSLEADDQLFSIDMAGALALFAQPKKSRRRPAAEPLRVLKPGSDSEKPITLRNGRYGPYVTDGEINASLRTGDDAATITLERAQELLQNRRDQGPRTKKKPTKRKATKKSPAKKKQAAKKKKTAAKRPAAKKTSASKARATKA